MAAYPWSVLGIAKTTDERVIKSAYAAKLKVTRPEVDAVKFQKLVAARDEAISRANNVAKKVELQPVTIKLKAKKKPKKVTTTKEEYLPNPCEFEIDHVANLCKCLSPQAIRHDFKSVGNSLEALKQFSIDEKAQAEWKLLEASQKYLCPDDDDATDNDKNNKHAGLKNHLLLKLDEEYAWTQNDRHVQEMLFWKSEDFIDHLQILKAGGQMQQPPKPQMSRIQKAVGYFALAMFALQILRFVLWFFAQQ
jgi:hypothetical protein